MSPSLTLEGWTGKRILSLGAGAGMIVASYLTIRHFFEANYPESIWEGSFCDISAFFNCDSSAYSGIADVAGVPIGVFGAVVGGMVMLGAILPSSKLERTNKSLALINGIGVVALLAYSVFVLGSLCLLCSGFYVFSLLSLFLFWRYGIDRDEPGGWRAGCGPRHRCSWSSPSSRPRRRGRRTGTTRPVATHRAAVWAYEQLRAIFQAVLEEETGGRFMENWVE